MATDMFGNILSPEEEEKQRRHAEAMGMLPPALRVQMTAPFGGGVGPQSYQGSFAIPPSVPDSLPLFADDNYYSQNITPVPTDVTVDPTMAGMAGVTQDYGPFSRSLGALSGMLAPAPSSSLPSYFDDPEVTKEMEALVDEDTADFAKDVLSQKVDDFSTMRWAEDPVSTIGGLIRDPLAPVELPDIVEKKQPYTSPMPRLSPEDMTPQTGFVPAPTNVDYSQVMTDAGMAEVSPVPSVPVSRGWPGIGTGYQGMGTVDTAVEEATRGMTDKEKHDMEDAVHHLDAVYGYATPGLEKSFQQGNTVTNLFDNAMRSVQKWGLGKATDILDMPGWGTLPAELNDILEGELDKREAIGDGLDKSRSDIQDLINNEIFMDARRSGISKDQMLDSILNQTNTLVALDTSDTGPLAAAAELSQDHGIPLTEDKVREMAFQQDTFTAGPTEARKSAQRQEYDQNVAVQAAPAKPSGPSPAEIARQNAVNAQMAQEAAARQRQQQAAVAAEQARQAQVARQQKSRLTMLLGSDRADPREIAALQAALGGYLGDPAGRQAGRDGPMSAAEINVAGGMEFGGAGGMAGSGRGSSGRGGPGGRGR